MDCGFKLVTNNIERDDRIWTWQEETITIVIFIEKYWLATIMLSYGSWNQKLVECLKFEFIDILAHISESL